MAPMRACVPCHERRRRCDRGWPCGPCTTTGISQECRYVGEEEEEEGGRSGFPAAAAPAPSASSFAGRPAAGFFAAGPAFGSAFPGPSGRAAPALESTARAYQTGSMAGIFEVPPLSSRRLASAAAENPFTVIADNAALFVQPQPQPTDVASPSSPGSDKTPAGGKSCTNCGYHRHPGCDRQQPCNVCREKDLEGDCFYAGSGEGYEKRPRGEGGRRPVPSGIRCDRCLWSTYKTGRCDGGRPCTVCVEDGRAETCGRALARE